jgi:hypothetical protein
MTEQAVKLPPYPTEIVTAPFTLDDCVFAPHIEGQIERAARDGQYVGDVLRDDNRFWFARKVDAVGELTDWKHMRSAAEARAFLVSRRL